MVISLGAYMGDSVTIRLAASLLLLCLSPISGICQSNSFQSGPAATRTATLRDAGTAKNVIIGAAADPRHLGEAPYAATLSTEFRQLEPENQMKLGPYILVLETTQQRTISLPRTSSSLLRSNTTCWFADIAWSGISKSQDG